MGRDDWGWAYVVEEETARAVGVLGHARGEALLADEGSRLVAKTAGNRDGGESGGGKGAVGGGVGGRDDLGEVYLGGIEAEEVYEGFVVIKCLEVHKHGSGRIGGIGYEHIVFGTAVQFVDEPAVYRSEGEITLVVGVFHGRDIFKEPQQFSNRWVG